MAPVFASADIAALVAAFPPSVPTQSTPSLVRSLSGNTLLNSKKVLEQFGTLLKVRTDRVRIKNLPSLLGIKESGWLFACHEGSLHFSRDKQSIIAAPEFETILRQLVSEAPKSFVELSSFTEVHDVSLGSIREGTLRDGTLHHLPDATSHRVVVTSPDHLESTKNDIRRAIEGAESERVNLSQRLPSVPDFVLRQLVETIRGEDGQVQGEVEESPNGIVFVPSSYDLAEKEKQKKAHALAVQDLVEALKKEGFCYLTTKNEDDRRKIYDDVCAAFPEHQLQAEDTPELVKVENEVEALVRQPMLHEVQDELIRNIKTLAGPTIPTDRVDIDSKTQAALVERSSRPELATLLLQSPYCSDVKSSLDFAILDLQRANFLAIDKVFRETLAAPLQLYSLGLVEEPTLKQHQEEYLSEYFRSEVIPTFVEHARSHGAHTYPKIRGKDLDKLSQQSSSAKTFSDLQTAVSKFAKKQEFPEPDAAQLVQVKKATLQQKAKAMTKMTRPSDVLQNLIWILLAQKSSGGLFLTAGKDTSRTIKQYFLVGDEGVGKRLEGWRDLLKAGQQSREDVQEMRELGMRSVEEMYGVEEVRTR